MGILVFGEKVKSKLDTFLVVVLLSVGLVGVSCATSTSSSEEQSSSSKNDDQTEPLLEVAFVENEKDGDILFNKKSSLGNRVRKNSHNENDDEPPPSSKPPLRFLHMDITRPFAGICGAVLNGACVGVLFVPLKYVRCVNAVILL